MSTSARRLGSLLIVLGVGVWGVYAVARFALGWDVSVRDFLPYHLVAMSPGLYLRNREKLTERRKRAVLALKRLFPSP